MAAENECAHRVNYTAQLSNAASGLLWCWQHNTSSTRTRRSPRFRIIGHFRSAGNPVLPSRP